MYHHPDFLGFQKFLLKQIAPVRIEELQKEIDSMIPLLKQQVDEAMPVQLKQHAEQVASKFFKRGRSISFSNVLLITAILEAKEAKDGEAQKSGAGEGEEANGDVGSCIQLRLTVVRMDTDRHFTTGKERRK
jgi:hypothetical protein